MRFKAYTVTAEQFASWIAHQQRPATFNPAPTTPAGAGQVQPPVAGQTPPNLPPGARPAGPPQTPPAPVQAGFVGFPRDRMPAYAVPRTPIPPAVRVDTALVGDATKGAQLVATGACIGCHTIKGVPTMVSKVGPDLTHIASRNTIAAGLFPNDARHLAAWIKNARAMKPGVTMPTLGRGQYDPIAKTTLSAGYTDQQIADIVAYLLALK
jgi:cytochrome c oxidase subunit II